MLPEAFIFDVDGTLAETEELHRRAFNTIFAEHGLDWNWSVEDYRILLRTTGGKERMRKHADVTGTVISDDEIAKMHRIKTERYGELLGSGAVALRPGIAELLELAIENGIRLAVATTTNRPNVDGLISATMAKPASEVFEVIAAGDEVSAKKPAPDVFLLALERLNLAGKNCLAFEDSANGLKSALGAAIPTLVSPSRYTEGESFEGAAGVVKQYAGLGTADIEAFMKAGLN